MPRTTRTITFSQPPEMAERLDQAMQGQGWFRSEFIREVEPSNERHQNIPGKGKQRRLQRHAMNPEQNDRGCGHSGTLNRHRRTYGIFSGNSRPFTKV